MQHISSGKIKQTSFLILLVSIGVLLFWELKSYLPSLLGALTFYFLLLKPMKYLTEKKKWKPSLSASILLLASFLVIIVPIYFFAEILYSKIDYAVHHSNNVIGGLKTFIAHIESQYHVTLMSDKNMEEIGKMVASWIPSLVGATLNSLLVVMIMYFILFFMLASYQKINHWLLKHLPLKHTNQKKIGQQLSTLVTSNALGLPITALLQGVIGVIGYWLLDVGDLSFWFVITALSSMVPKIGSGLAFTSIALLMFARGEETKAILVIAYGITIMSVLDEVFRIYIQKKFGDTHPLVTTFGVIIGLHLFGFMGLIFGPIIISLFILLVQVYFDEFSNEDTEIESS